MCKVFVAEAVGRVLDRCLQVCGATGIAREGLIERLYRDARAFRIYDGPSEVHRMRAGENRGAGPLSPGNGGEGVPAARIGRSAQCAQGRCRGFLEHSRSADHGGTAPARPITSSRVTGEAD